MVTFVRFTTKVNYFLVESNGVVELELAVSRPGVCFDIHGGCADIYQFSIPANMSVVDARTIISYRVNYAAPSPSEHPETGLVSIASTASGCEVSVNLLSKAGKPLPVNGTFKQLQCGQNS